MKKSILFSTALLSMAAFSSCSSYDEPVVVAGEGDVQEIVLQVSNTGDGLTTSRGGRQLLSSEANQNITDVMLYFVDQNGIVRKVYRVKEWMTYSEVYGDGGHGRQKVIKFEGNDRLAAGNYTVYAIGYNAENSNYSNLSVLNIAEEEEFPANLKLNVASGKKADEIFAGTHALEVVSGFKTSIILNRQVAGSYGYFEAIPYDKDAAKLRLVASGANSSLILGQCANTDFLYNGKIKNEPLTYVINGTTASTDKVIYEIDLAAWFQGGINDEDDNGIIDNEGWAIPAGQEGKYKTGSVFGGNFIVPFAKADTESNTLVLQLVAKDGTTVLNEWAVRLPSGDRQLNEYNLIKFNGTNFGDSPLKRTDTAKWYNILRNHLYALGQRALDKPTDPDNPTPDPENPDEPQPLNKAQELTLRVNDNWELIHTMGLEVIK